MFRGSLVTGLLAACAIIVPAIAAQTAHVHGEGRVNIAIEGNQVFMMLESPGADIVGFEHQARSSEEKKAVAGAIEQLRDAGQVLRFDPAGECRLQTAKASLKGDSHEHDEHAKHDEHDGHDDEESHGAFVAEYEFTCAKIDSLEVIEFVYFSHFANAQSLDIVLIDGSGQRRVEVDRGNPEFRLVQ